MIRVGDPRSRQFPVVRRVRTVSPSPFGFGLGQDDLSVDTSGKSREELLRAAGDLMIRGGAEVENALLTTRLRYEDVGSHWLAKAAASLAAGPTGPALQVLWQSNKANQAVAALNAVAAASQKWLNEMTGKWIPEYIDAIAEVDPGLADRVGKTFDAVVEARTPVIQLIGETEQLPPRVLIEATLAFAGKLLSQIEKFGIALLRILEALGRTVEATIEAAGGAAGAIRDFPTVAVVIGLAAVAFIALR